MRFIAVAAGLATIAVLAAPARAHWAPLIPHHNAHHATQLVWCGGSNVRCPAGDEAWRVAYCETGGTYNLYAVNGQYLGLWQMGSAERARWGRGRWAWNPWAQARAAFAYYYATLLRTGYGWYPWTCRP